MPQRLFWHQPCCTWLATNLPQNPTADSNPQSQHGTETHLVCCCCRASACVLAQFHAAHHAATSKTFVPEPHG
jgi:hypothetical protein